MYRSLLVPLDGSELGEHALPMALSLARRLGAALRIVRVYMPMGGVYGEYGGYDEVVDRAMRENARAYLDAVAERLAAVADVPLSSALLVGPVVDMIDQHAKSTGTDLLIMTTHGRGPLARFWLGSVADALVRQASVPILLVRPQETVPDLALEPVLRRVLIPLDGSDLSEQVLEPALALGAASSAEYTLLRVIEPMTPTGHGLPGGGEIGILESLSRPPQEGDRRRWAEAQEYLERLAERLRARSLAVRTRVISQDRPASAILAAAEEGAIDLIALATQGRGGLKRLLLGSVADKVLRGAATPVLVNRPVDRSPSVGG